MEQFRSGGRPQRLGHRVHQSVHLTQRAYATTQSPVNTRSAKRSTSFMDMQPHDHRIRIAYVVHDLRVRWRKRLSLALTVCILSVMGAAGFGGAVPAYASTSAPMAITTAPLAIPNGEDTDDGDYPFSVKLTMIDLPEAGGGTRDSSCSGGLVNSRWVLTAGHCFKDASGKRVAKPVAKRTVATIGRADLSGSAGQEAKVIAV